MKTKMKKVILLNLIMGGFAVAADDFSKDLLFHLDFENQTKAVCAKGSPEGRFLGGDQKKLRLVPGNRGLGFLTGSSKNALQYQLRGNLKTTAGTLTFWQKKLDNVQFSRNDKKHHIFFEIMATRSMNLLFYKYGDSFRPGILDRYRADGKNLSHWLYLPGENAYDPSAWHHYAYVWNGRKEELYMDGLPVARVERQIPFPESEKGTITFGQSWGSKDADNRIMDEIRIYGKVMTPAEIFALYQRENRIPPSPMVSVSPASAKITVDGIMGKDEYTSASAVPLLFVNKTMSVADVITKVYLTYDHENLYLFMRSPIGGKVFEKAHTALLNGMFLRERTTHDMDLDNDDSLIIDLLNGTKTYYLAANSLDVRYDYAVTWKDAKNPVIRLDWNPAWKTVSRVAEHGWDMECSIPLKELGIVPGKHPVLDLNLIRNWKQLKLQADSFAQDPLSDRGALHKEKKYGRLRFAGQENIAVAFDRIDVFNCNGADFTATLKNTGKQDREVVAEFRKDAEPPFRKTIRIPAGSHVPFTCSRKFASPAARLSFKVASPDGKTEYFAFSNPVFVLEDIQLRTASYPSRKELVFSGSFPQLNLNLKHSRAEVQILKDGKTVLERVKPLTALDFTMEIPYGSLEDGDYDVLVRIREHERTVAERKSTFAKRPLPSWFGNTIGISDKVPYPWTPVKADGLAVEVLNRKYVFGNGVLPEQILISGENILRGPVRVELNGKPLQMKNRIISRKDTEAVVEGKCAQDNVEMTMNSTVEYDGFMWHKFTLSSRRKGQTVERLQIVIPLKAEYSTLMSAYDYTLAVTGRLKNWNGDVRPLWVGNADVGLAFAAEHSHNWRLDRVNRALETGIEKDGGSIRINLVSKGLKLDSPETFEFSLQATPAKPAAPEFRRMRFVSVKDVKTFLRDENNADFLIWWSGGWSEVSQSGGDVCYPKAKKSLTPARMNWKSGTSQVSVLPYFQLHETWGDSPEFKQFGYEWVCGPNLPVVVARKTQDNRSPVCQASRSFQDFTLSGLKAFAEQADLRGFYFDMSMPVSCRNLRHGCGYVKDGQVLPTTNIRGARNMVKRIYTMLAERRKDVCIVYHNSGQICPQVHGFAGAFINGENFVSRLYKNRGYEEILRPDVYLAGYRGQHFGVVSAFLPEFRISNELRKAMKNPALHTAGTKAEYDELGKHQNYLFGLSLLHESQTSTGWLYHRESKEKSFRILRDIRYSDPSVKFIPYWKQKICPLDNKDGIVSFYAGKDSAAVILMNLSPVSRTFSLKLDCLALGLSGAVQADNLHYPEKTVMQNNILTVDNVPPMEYRAVRLTVKK